MPSVEIVAIGTEILLGHLSDTNSAHIARALADRGVDVYLKHAVGDNPKRLEALLRGAMDRADGVITTGGLGPTVDDLTKEAVALAVGTTLELHEPSVAAIERRMRAFGREGPVSQNNLRQAFLPKGAYVLENPNGSAPGFVARRADGKFVACMPGVPREMKPMLEERLLPWLAENYALESAIYTRTLHTVGIAESELDARIDDLFRNLENPKIAMLAHEGKVDVKIMAKAPDAASAAKAIAPIEEELRARIGAGLFGFDSDTLEGAVVGELTRRGLTIATAESITGGGIADALVRVPGASRTFLGAIVAYDNMVKIEQLGVAPDMLAEHGAVSEPVARAMALGARERLKTAIALASTGVAGPSGGSDRKPVGLVYLALAMPDGEVLAQRVQLPGNRDDVRRRAVIRALDMLWRAFAPEYLPGTIAANA